jgi:ElaB/YqjD/DUF883 family membrane-anchored ribosome-binding protein
MFSTAAFAQNGDLLSVDLGTRDLNSKEIQELVKDPDKLQKRLQKDIQFLSQQSEKAMNEESKKYGQKLNAARNKGDVQALTGSNVSLGTDATYYFTDTGATGYSTSGLAYTLENWGNYYADSESNTSGIGSGSSWATTSKQINVTGSGSQGAYIRFAGKYTGYLAPGYMGGNSHVRIRVSVYDLTVGSELGGNVVAERTESVGSGWSTTDTAFNSSVWVNLQAGHSYLLRYGVATDVSNYSPQVVIADFYNNNHGAYVDNVRVDF